MKNPTFRGREPVRLAFGTSGLRGLVIDITDLEAYINTRGFLAYVLETADAAPGSSVAVAGDLRPSTDSPERSILRAVARAIEDAGFRVVHCGKIPTPALAFFALQKGWASVMVTGSHIPFDRNGIKFNKSTGEVLKTDEAPILAAVEAARRLEYSRPSGDSPFADDGMFAPGVAGPQLTAIAEARELYVRRYLDFFPGGALAGKRIVVYEHSAVGREMLAEILRQLGAEVHAMGRSEGFVAIDTEAITDQRLQELQRMADEARSRFGAIDAIVSTDGDSDRPMLIGIDDRDAVRFFGGDILGVVVADYLQTDAMAVPVSATDAVDLHFRDRGLQVVRTRIGSPWVIAAMAELRGERRVGWEANGGFMTGSEIELNGRRLAPLPTRDAVLPILAALYTAEASSSSLVRVFDRLPKRSSKAGLLDAFPPESSRALLRRFSPGEPEVRQAIFGGDAVRWLDSAGEEREAIGPQITRFEEIRDGLGRHFGPDRGFGAIDRIDFLDGVRIFFGNGDIAHVRPSGNAPQLRIYAVADTEERAAEIVAGALREPDGILREMQGRV